jgi:hypothetical protein
MGHGEGEEERGSSSGGKDGGGRGDLALLLRGNCHHCSQSCSS